MEYYLNNVKVQKPSTLRFQDKLYLCPTDDIIIAAGYEIREDTIVKPSYESLVVSYIREKYSIDDEFALLRQRDTKPDEFAEYNDFCEQCKTRARNELTETQSNDGGSIGQ